MGKYVCHNCRANKKLLADSLDRESVLRETLAKVHELECRTYDKNKHQCGGCYIGDALEFTQK